MTKREIIASSEIVIPVQSSDSTEHSALKREAFSVVRGPRFTEAFQMVPLS
jgi:hypothetical protein